MHKNNPSMLMALVGSLAVLFATGGNYGWCFASLELFLSLSLISCYLRDILEELKSKK